VFHATSLPYSHQHRFYLLDINKGNTGNEKADEEAKKAARGKMSHKSSLLDMLR
jgi:hypothetical protein